MPVGSEYVEPAVEIVEDESARAHIDALSQKYLGTPYGAEISSPRVILKVAADKII